MLFLSSHCQFFSFAQPFVTAEAVMERKLLVLNAGSSSLKYKVFGGSLCNLEVLTGGLVERIGDTSSTRSAETEQSYSDSPRKKSVSDHTSALNGVLKLLKRNYGDDFGQQLLGTGHRVVHGKHISRAVLVDEQALEDIQNAAEFAPLHNTANLQGILAAQEAFPGKPAVAVFDTAFHQTMPRHACTYPLPYELLEANDLKKYGAHGTSVQYLAKIAAKMLQKPCRETNLIIAHLGAGASMTAVKNGKSIDTSMGLTPLEGLMMGTRCGDIDPSLVTVLHASCLDEEVLYLLRHCGMSADDVDNLLNRESGFKGLAGMSDIRAVSQAANVGNDRALLAVDVFVHRLRKYLGAYLVHLEGNVDAIVFSGGVGENSIKVRQETVQGLQRFGIVVDLAKNATIWGGKAGSIHADSSQIKLLVIPTDEELAIAEQTLAAIQRTL